MTFTYLWLILLFVDYDSGTSSNEFNTNLCGFFFSSICQKCLLNASLVLKQVPRNNKVLLLSKTDISVLFVCVKH